MSKLIKHEGVDQGLVNSDMRRHRQKTEAMLVTSLASFPDFYNDTALTPLKSQRVTSVDQYCEYVSGNEHTISSQ